MLTERGARRRLYLDATISVQGLFEPMSALGSDLLRQALTAITLLIFNKDITAELDESIPHVAAGKIFLNLSALLHFAGKEKLAGFFSGMDAVLGPVLLSVEEERYRAQQFESRTTSWYRTDSTHFAEHTKRICGESGTTAT